LTFCFMKSCSTCFIYFCTSVSISESHGENSVHNFHQVFSLTPVPFGTFITSSFSWLMALRIETLRGEDCLRSDSEEWKKTLLLLLKSNCYFDLQFDEIKLYDWSNMRPIFQTSL
jgi:hypothetical protein